MKYGIGMTHFKKDIITAIKKLLTGDKEITKKFKAEDGSLARLREYLKERYGTYQGYRGDGVWYNCRSTGMILRFDIILNNPGDKELTLSWSQVAKFIRDNWNEIFSITPKSSYREALKKEFPRLTDKMIDKSSLCCPGHFFDGDNVPCYADCNENTVEEACSKCWNKPCEGTYNGEPFDPSDWEDDSEEDEQKSDFPCDNCAHDVQGCCDYPDTADDYCVQGDKQVPVNSTTETQTESEALPKEIIPERAAEISETFNYATLSAELGDFLKRKEQQLKNEYISFTANCGEIFAEAQEKLAGNNQYNGLFEKWIVSMGFKKSSVYNMISVYNFCSSNNWTSNQKEVFENLPKLLQYDVSAKNAPPELVEQVMNGDITTHKDYIALKKQLEEEKFRANHLKEKLDEKSKKIGELNDKNIGLEKQVKDLQKKPVDVAVQDVDEEEIHRRAAEYAQGIIRSKETEFNERLREMQKENCQLKKEISEAGRTELDDCFNDNDSVNEETVPAARLFPKLSERRLRRTNRISR